MVARRNRWAEGELRRKTDLWAAIIDYSKGSDTTGASMSDYLTLY